MSGNAALHAASMKNVVTFAREVRIRLRDTRIIFASIVSAQDPIESDAFVVRPWGVPWTTTFRYAEAALVAPVRHMGWQAQQAICRKQSAEFAALKPLA